MAERRLVILQYSDKTPVLAMCESCSLKFFTMRSLLHRPAEAEVNLQQRFNSHVCQREGRGHVQPIRKG